MAALRGGTFWSWASSEEEFQETPPPEKLNSIEIFIAFYSSPAHPPFASYNHVLAKHS
jgi:hypothetical protein